MIIGIEANHANKNERTGVENYCWQIINNLKKQMPSDVRVILYTQKDLLPGLSEEMPANWEVKILKWPFSKLWSQLRLSWEFLINPPDVFFAPGQLIPFFCPEKTYVTLHDSAFLVNKEAYSFWGRMYLTWMNKRIIKKAKKILTPSEFTRREIFRLYSYVLPEEVMVTPLAYDKNIFRIFSQEEKDPGFLPRLKIIKPFVIYLGRLEEKKNVLGLIKAFNLLKKEVDAQLVLVGKGLVGFEKIKDEIEASPFSEDIIMTGWLKDDEVAQLLNRAELFVFPSFYEGFGLPTLEAFACGCPVAAAKGHSLEEVGRESAVYFNPHEVNEIYEKTKRFFVDKEFRNKQSTLGLERVKNYSWDKTAFATAKILCELQN